MEFTLKTRPTSGDWKLLHTYKHWEDMRDDLRKSLIKGYDVLVSWTTSRGHQATALWLPGLNDCFVSVHGTLPARQTLDDDIPPL